MDEKLAAYSNIIMQKDKICIELTFNKVLSYSKKKKVKDFWKFIEETKPFEPFKIVSSIIIFHFFYKLI